MSSRAAQLECRAFRAQSHADTGWGGLGCNKNFSKHFWL